jgi:hypothetical protein
MSRAQPRELQVGRTLLPTKSPRPRCPNINSMISNSLTSPTRARSKHLSTRRACSRAVRFHPNQHESDRHPTLLPKRLCECKRRRSPILSFGALSTRAALAILDVPKGYLLLRVRHHILWHAGIQNMPAKECAAVGPRLRDRLQRNHHRMIPISDRCFVFA